MANGKRDRTKENSLETQKNRPPEKRRSESTMKRYEDLLRAAGAEVISSPEPGEGFVITGGVRKPKKA